MVQVDLLKSKLEKIFYQKLGSDFVGIQLTTIGEFCPDAAEGDKRVICFLVHVTRGHVPKLFPNKFGGVRVFWTECDAVVDIGGASSSELADPPFRIT